MFYASMNNTFSRLGGMEERLNQITRLSGGGKGGPPGGAAEGNNFESKAGSANEHSFAFRSSALAVDQAGAGGPGKEKSVSDFFDSYPNHYRSK